MVTVQYSLSFTPEQWGLLQWLILGEVNSVNYDLDCYAAGLRFSLEQSDSQVSQAISDLTEKKRRLLELSQLLESIGEDH